MLITLITFDADHLKLNAIFQIISYIITRRGVHGSFSKTVSTMLPASVHVISLGNRVIGQGNNCLFYQPVLVLSIIANR